MKKLIAYFGEHGLFADLSTVFVLAIGLGSAFLIERKVMPNVEFGFVTIQTPYPGASAEEVERLITSPLEQNIKEVEGIKKLTSTSREGNSFIAAQLDPDQTTVEKAKTDIRDAVDRFTDRPADAEDTLVSSINSNLEPVIKVSLFGNVDEKVLKETAKRLEISLEAISGVANVVIEGSRDTEYRVEADPNKLRQYQISLDDLVSTLQRQNRNIPGGLVEASPLDDQREIIVRTVGEFKTLEDVGEAVIRANALGEAVKVSDVATVKETFEKASTRLRTNGRKSMNLTILKQASSDAIDVVDQVKERVEKAKASFTDGIGVQFLDDSSYYIRRRLGVLSGNLMIGLLLVIVFLTLFMPWRVSLITAIGIPFAFFGAISIMHVADISFNLITMMGLIIVVGMLVDDAVVVTENVVRQLETGLPPREAAVKGTQQIWAPVTASVMTTVMAFLPMVVMSGIFGQFVRYIPIAVIVALAISLYECYFILPHHLARWVTPKVMKDAREKSWLRGVRNFWDNQVAETYSRILKICLKKRYLVALASLSIFIGTLIWAGKGMKFVLFPKDGIEMFYLNLESNVGTSLAEMSELVRPYEDEISKIPKSEMNDFTTKVGVQRLNVSDPQVKRGSHFAQIIVYLTPDLERERSADDILESIRENVVKPEKLIRVSFERVNPGPPVGKPISVGVNGENYDEIMEAVKGLKEFISKIPGTTDIEDSYYKGKDEVQVIVNKAEAVAAGLSVVQIGTTVRAAYDGIVATTVRKLDEEIDIRVSLPHEDRASLEALNKLMIPNAVGNLIPLKRVATLNRTQSIEQFDHEANRRQVRVSGNVDVDIASAIEVADKIRDYQAEFEKKFPKVTLSFGGEDEDTKESMQSLIRSASIAIFGIFMILVLTFNSLWQPLLVVATIPLGITSIIWAFGLHSMPISFLGMIGMIALAGVIVNNAIVFIDFVNQERKKGLDNFDSIVAAGKMRIRPIFLTTVTTVCGILPTAYGLGGLDQFVVPVAMALGWGMAFGSIQAVIVLPALILILDDILNLGRKVFRRNVNTP